MVERAIFILLARLRKATPVRHRIIAVHSVPAIRAVGETRLDRAAVAVGVRRLPVRVADESGGALVAVFARGGATMPVFSAREVRVARAFGAGWNALTAETLAAGIRAGIFAADVVFGALVVALTLPPGDHERATSGSVVFVLTQLRPITVF
jgi:hypothetical protein